MKEKRHVLRCAAAAVLSAAVAFTAQSLSAEGEGDAVLKLLLDGNKKFVQGKPAGKDTGAARRRELTGGQHPYATVVTCSDSRVPPELIFSQGLGEIFVIRVAGNVLDEIAMGSVEYGVEHLHTPLLVILGHQKCGAVKATMESRGDAHGAIGDIVRMIRPAVEKARKTGATGEALLDRAILDNMKNVRDSLLRESPAVRDLYGKKTLSVVSALYRLDSGKVVIVEK